MYFSPKKNSETGVFHTLLLSLTQHDCPIDNKERRNHQEKQPPHIYHHFPTVTLHGMFLLNMNEQVSTFQFWINCQSIFLPRVTVFKSGMDFLQKCEERNFLLLSQQSPLLATELRELGHK